jgi:hypothetical protein
VLALALGGLAAAVPAEASAGSPAKASPAAFIQTVVTLTDSLNPTGLSAPDAIVTCATKKTTVNAYDAIAIPAGCLTLYNGEWVKVTWSGAFIDDYLLLTQQDDGNLVLQYSVAIQFGPEWTSKTTFALNANGPGCQAQFKSTGNLAVNNCDTTQIYATGTQNDSSAVLVFAIGADNNFQIFNSLGGSVVWAG